MIDPTNATDTELLLNAQNRARVVMARMLQPVIENPLDPEPMKQAAHVQRMLAEGLSGFQAAVSA